MDRTPSLPHATMPDLLYGTAWKKERTAELVELAVSLGFRGIDTACQPKHYDEAGVGAGVAACLGRGLTREALYLQTKFTSFSGQDPARVPYPREAPLATQIQRSCEVSLANLRTSYLDALLLHSPMPTLERTLEAWSAFEELVERGVVVNLGISNCYSLEQLTALYERASVKPRVLQNRFYKKTGYDTALRAFCATHDVRYQSFWTLTANPQVLKARSLRAIAARHRVTPEQTFFRCLIHAGITPLTGTCTREHMQQDLDVCTFELETDEVRTILGLCG